MSFGQHILLSAPIGLFVAIMAWPNGEPVPEKPVAQEYAKIFNGVFPKTTADGTYIAAPKADGDTLVFTITPSGDLSESFSSAEMERLNVNAACVSGDGLTGFFGKGGKLRFDIAQVDGSVHQGTTRSNC